MHWTCFIRKCFMKGKTGEDWPETKKAAIYAAMGSEFLTISDERVICVLALVE